MFYYGKYNRVRLYCIRENHYEAVRPNYTITTGYFGPGQPKFFELVRQAFGVVFFYTYFSVIADEHSSKS